MKKRVFSVLLSLCLMLSLVPALGSTAEAAGASSMSDQILNLNATKPSNYDSLAATDPYSKGTNNQFLLNERNRLMLYQTENDNYYVERTINGNFTLSDDPDSSHNIDYQPMSEIRDTSKASTTNLSNTTKTMAFVSSISYNPTGSGNRDHAAFVGIDAVDQKVKVWVQNTSTGATSAAVTLGDEAVSWNKNITQYNYHAFLTLTAGNYDGDASGKETFIVYFPGTTTADPELCEFSLSESESGTTLTLSKKATIFLNNSLLYSNVNAQDIMNGSCFQIPTISLATGDFDGDGRQELAVAAGSYKQKDTTSISNMECYATKLSVLKFSGRDSNNNLKYKIPYSTYLYDTIAQTKDSSDTLTSEQYRLLYAGSVAAGDVNGDGQDEIIASGYTGTAKNNFSASGDVTSTSNVYVRSGSDLCIATVSYSAAKASYSRTAVGTVSMNKFTTGHIANDKDSWPMMATTCVKINGDAAADCFFLSGTLYEWEDGSPAPVFTPDYFTKSYNSANGHDLQMTWVDAAVAGSFDGNAAGRQQLVLTVGIKFSAVSGSMGDAEYAYKLGLIAGTGYSDTYESDNTIKSYGSATAYCSSDIQANGAFADGSNGNNFGSSSAANTSKVLNFVPVVTDSGKSIKAKLNSTNWVYTDPQVEAVLQAAPYFGELNDYSEFVNPGQTTYSVTTSYTFGKTSENNVSFGVGFAGEGKVNLGAAVKISAEAGYTLDWSHTYDRSLTTSYTNTFTSGEYDTVILQRTPMVVYSYNIYDEKGNWVDDAYQISVPLEPTFYQMTVEEYNQFVDDFAAWYKSNYPSSNDSSVLLSKITSEMLPENSDGDPTAYRTSWDPASMQIGTSNVSDNAVSLSKGTKTIGYGGATATSEWTQESSYNEGVTMNHGFHTSLTVQGGVGAVGNEGLVGGYVSLDYNHGTGSYKTNTKENGASGTVADINSKALLKDKGIPESVSREYGFTWSFGKWDVDLGGTALDCSLKDQNNKPLYNNNVMFFGYAVSNIKRPSAAVTDLKASLTSENTAALTWTAPANTGRPDISGYNVYQLGSDGKYTLLNQSPISSDTFSYVYSKLTNSNTDYSFVITALSANGESIWSNVATVSTPKQYYTLKFSGNASATAGYEGVSVKSGGKCPEDTIVYISAKVLDGYALTGYRIGSNTQMTFDPCQTKDFSFRFPSADTTVAFITQPVSSEISYKSNDENAGSVTASAGGTQLDGDATVTTSVTFKAAANSGYVLTKWIILDSDNISSEVSDDGSGTLMFNPVKSGYSITANFESTGSAAGQKTVTIATPQFGSITVTDGSGTVLTPNQNGEIKAVLNSNLTFKAVPAEFYSLKGWTGDLSGTVNPQIVKVSGDMSLGADFSAPVMYKVSFGVSPAAGGSVSAVNGGAALSSGTTVAKGSTISFKAVPSANYVFSGWTVNASANSSAADNMTLTITSKTSVTASFAAVYTVSASAGTGGTITPSGSSTVKAGGSIMYGITPSYGYTISDVTVDGKSVGAVSTYQFSNVAENHAISASFAAQSTPGGTGGGAISGGGTAGSKTEYTLNFDTTGGSAIAAITKAGGTVVDLSSFKPTRESFAFAGWYADEDLTKAVSSVELKADTTVYAKWDWVNPFTDVKEGDYFYDAVKWASGSGVTGGITPTGFAPDMTCTRAQAVTFLWRAAGSPAPKTTVMPFTDVPKDSYYYSAVLWAVENGIAKGTSDTTFSPDLDCSRAQIMTFLWRANGSKSGTAANPFVDVGSSDYYYDAVLWAVTNDITVGTSANTYSPGGDCTRAQIVTFIYRELEKQNTK